MATIEVLLPVKNALPYLSESIDSVLSQTFKDWRLLILDHGSTDGSLEVAHNYAERDKRIVVHSNQNAIGLGGLLNFGLDIADGRFIVRQDGDDISLPHRFQTVVDTFSQEPDLTVLGGEATVIDGTGRAIGYINRPSTPDAIAAANFFYNPIQHPTIALKLSRIKALGAVYGEDILKVVPKEQSMRVLSLAEDYFLFGQLALIESCRNIKGPLIKYRYHGRSESVSKRAAQNQCALDISRFLSRSFSKMKGTRFFDPAPFCSHAENVFDCGKANYSAEFEIAENAIYQGLGVSPGVQRELSFRRVLANRSYISTAARYTQFGLTYGWRQEEYRLIRNYLASVVNDKMITEVSGGVVVD